MAAGNNVTLVGNLVEDPELRFTPSGIAMAKIRLAVNRRWQANGEWQEEVSFFGGTLWRDIAENAAESLTKGTRVIVSGSLEQRRWETETGDKRSIIELRIDDIAPSLRWATAVVTRTPRKGDSDAWSSPGVNPSAGDPANDGFEAPAEAPF